MSVTASFSCLCMTLDEVEDLLSGETVYKTYEHRLRLESDTRMAVQVKEGELYRQSEERMMADCHVEVLSITTRQRGKGLKRPQFDHIYAFRAVD